MSAFEPARTTLTTLFQSQFKRPPVPPAAAAEWFPVAYDNKQFQQPNGGKTWGRFSVRFGTREPLGVSVTEFRTMGFVALQVFLAEEKGTKDATEAADKVSDLLDNASIAVPGKGVVLMRQTSLSHVGKTQEGWFQVNVTCNFQFDERAA